MRFPCLAILAKFSDGGIARGRLLIAALAVLWTRAAFMSPVPRDTTFQPRVARIEWTDWPEWRAIEARPDPWWLPFPSFGPPPPNAVPYTRLQGLVWV